MHALLGGGVTDVPLYNKLGNGVIGQYEARTPWSGDLAGVTMVTKVVSDVHSSL